MPQALSLCTYREVTSNELQGRVPLNCTILLFRYFVLLSFAWVALMVFTCHFRRSVEYNLYSTLRLKWQVKTTPWTQERPLLDCMSTRNWWPRQMAWLYGGIVLGVDGDNNKCKDLFGKFYSYNLPMKSGLCPRYHGYLRQPSPWDNFIKPLYMKTLSLYLTSQSWPRWLFITLAE